MREERKQMAREQYLLRATFFYNRLNTEGYFSLAARVKQFVSAEGERLDWAKRTEWNISESAWEAIGSLGITPALVFAHPKTLKINSEFLRYYRSIALLPQKGLAVLAQVSNVNAIEMGKADSGNLRNETVLRLVNSLNEAISTIVSIAPKLNARKLEGMMYVTAGTTIDGSWRNQIGAEGERVVKTIILNGLLSTQEVSSFTDKKNNTVTLESKESTSLTENIDLVKCINLKNGYSIYFASEPDVTLFDREGSIVGVVEIKAGVDPAAALERLGAVFKSFENTLAEYPNATTILVASCTTKEVDTRLNASLLVRQKYVMAEITASDVAKRKFVNRLRVLLNLTQRVL